MERTNEPKSTTVMRRRTFLIDRKFQLKYTFIIVVVGVVVSAILGTFVYRLSMITTDMATMDINTSQAADPQGEEGEFLERTRDEIRNNFDRQVLYSLVGFVAIMAIFLFIWGVFITHRVAGPIYIISSYLKSLSEGEVPKLRPLRRGDQLKDFFEIFSNALEQLKISNIKEAEALEQCASELQAGGDPAYENTSIVLKKIAARKRSWEGDE